ncbi:hypothetical protein ACH427_04575 [Streptomyces sp. NPDC020379]|uniref:hypothetical protein n=1 Tax=Streptomyces sp. NPDC020379 TaxID=3365071 RepID=UPI00379174B9
MPKAEDPATVADDRTMTGMDAEMREAFERAVRTATGYFYGSPEAVLTRLVDMGIAHQAMQGGAQSLTDKGWELGTLPDPVSPNGTKYRVTDNARWVIPIELVDPTPDTRGPGFDMVRPRAATITLIRNRARIWCVSSVAVWGPKVRDGKVTTTREYSTLFAATEEAPEWLQGICQEWVDRANGWGTASAMREPVKESAMTLKERVARLEKLAGIDCTGADFVESPGPPPQKPPHRRTQLLALIRESGGRWNWKRARGALATVNGDNGSYHQADLNKDLATLAEAGYLAPVDREKFVYELVPDSNTKSGFVGRTQVTDARAQLEQRIRVAVPEDSAETMLGLLEQVVQETRREQARLDSELMQKMSDRAPKTTPPKDGTTSRAVYAAAADILNPDGQGWSLELPEHLREEAE